MVSAKMLVSSICFVSLVFLFGNISARPADTKVSDILDDSKVKNLLDGGGTHVHKIGDGGNHVHHHGNHVHKISGGGDGGTHVHKISGGGDGGTHVHKISDGGNGGVHTHVHRTETKGEPHVHKFKTGGDDGDLHVHHYRQDGPSDININEKIVDADAPPAKVPDSGAVDDTIIVPKIFANLDADTIAKLKSHQFGHFGVDSTKPKLCDDEYYFNDGVLKHFVRGTRDAGDALFSGLDNIIKGILPEIGPVDNALDAVKNGLQGILCGAEDVFSDFADHWDSATHIAKHGLIDAFKLQNDGLLAIPEGIAGIAEKAVEAAGDGVADVVSGLGTGVEALLDGL